VLEPNLNSNPPKKAEAEARKINSSRFQPCYFRIKLKTQLRAFILG